MKKWITDKYWVSPFNYVDEVVKQLADMPKKVRIHDATLRDGEQTPGVVFTKEEKVQIATMLDDMRVDRIEVALPAVSQDDVEAIKAVVAKNLNAEIFAFCRGVEKDIDISAECGVDGIILELPLGTPRLKYQFAKWDEETLFEKTLHCVKYAKEKGLYVTLFPMDATRAEEELFEKFLSVIANAEVKPDSIALVDTTGCLIPQAAAYMVRRIKEVTQVSVEIHSHSEMGLGVSTSLAAVAAGADVVHTSVAGLGERTGNTPLEQVVVALKALMDVELNIDFSKLTEYGRKVAEIAKFTLPLNKPIIGERAFTRESGMGLDLIFETPLALFSLEPSFVGQSSNYVLGKKSGVGSVELKCKEMGFENIADEVKREILAQVKSLSISKKGLVSDEEFANIVKSLTQPSEEEY